MLRQKRRERRDVLHAHVLELRRLRRGLARAVPDERARPRRVRAPAGERARGAVGRRVVDGEAVVEREVEARAWGTALEGRDGLRGHGERVQEGGEVDVVRLVVGRAVDAALGRHDPRGVFVGREEQDVQGARPWTLLPRRCGGGLPALCTAVALAVLETSSTVNRRKMAKLQRRIDSR